MNFGVSNKWPWCILRAQPGIAEDILMFVPGLGIGSMARSGIVQLSFFAMPIYDF
jgi:hypothetical protein